MQLALENGWQRSKFGFWRKSTLVSVQSTVGCVGLRVKQTSNCSSLKSQKHSFEVLNSGLPCWMSYLAIASSLARYHLGLKYLPETPSPPMLILRTSFKDRCALKHTPSASYSDRTPNDCIRHPPSQYNYHAIDRDRSDGFNRLNIVLWTRL